MSAKKIFILFFILLSVSLLFECNLLNHLSTKTLIQEEVILSEKYSIQSYITNCVSDPEYARLFINNVEVFRCRGAHQILFKIENNILTIYTDGNLEYKYDRIQKDNYKELQIVYLQL